MAHAEVASSKVPSRARGVTRADEIGAARDAHRDLAVVDGDVPPLLAALVEGETPPAGDEWVTATATDADGSTSESSECLPLRQLLQLAIVPRARRCSRRGGPSV